MFLFLLFISLCSALDPIVSNKLTINTTQSYYLDSIDVLDVIAKDYGGYGREVNDAVIYSAHVDINGNMDLKVSTGEVTASVLDIDHETGKLNIRGDLQTYNHAVFSGSSFTSGQSKVNGNIYIDSITESYYYGQDLSALTLETKSYGPSPPGKRDFAKDKRDEEDYYTYKLSFNKTGSLSFDLSTFTRYGGEPTGITTQNILSVKQDDATVNINKLEASNLDVTDKANVASLSIGPESESCGTPVICFEQYLMYSNVSFSDNVFTNISAISFIRINDFVMMNTPYLNLGFTGTSNTHVAFLTPVPTRFRPVNKVYTPVFASYLGPEMGSSFRQTIPLELKVLSNGGILIMGQHNEGIDGTQGFQIHPSGVSWIIGS